MTRKIMVAGTHRARTARSCSMVWLAYACLGVAGCGASVEPRLGDDVSDRDAIVSDSVHDEDAAGANRCGLRDMSVVLPGWEPSRQRYSWRDEQPDQYWLLDMGRCRLVQFRSDTRRVVAYSLDQLPSLEPVATSEAEFPDLTAAIVLDEIADEILVVRADSPYTVARLDPQSLRTRSEFRLAPPEPPRTSERMRVGRGVLHVGNRLFASIFGTRQHIDGTERPRGYGVWAYDATTGAFVSRQPSHDSEEQVGRLIVDRRQRRAAWFSRIWSPEFTSAVLIANVLSLDDFVFRRHDSQQFRRDSSVIVTEDQLCLLPNGTGTLLSGEAVLWERNQQWRLEPIGTSAISCFALADGRMLFLTVDGPNYLVVVQQIPGGRPAVVQEIPIMPNFWNFRPVLQRIAGTEYVAWSGSWFMKVAVRFVRIPRALTGE